MHEPMLLLKGEPHQHLHTHDIVSLATMKLFNNISFITPPLIMLLNIEIFFFNEVPTEGFLVSLTLLRSKYYRLPVMCCDAHHDGVFLSLQKGSSLLILHYLTNMDRDGGFTPYIITQGIWTDMGV
jgi:hypothetical protein